MLGILYESFIHPLTILSTLPSAGVGALLALMLFKVELSIIAMIGIMLLIGIVKKNAIMMIDFALVAERQHGKTPREAIYEACLLRFRPIMMTTMAALLGGIPLALGTGTGSELRRPLGISIVGGLIVSQCLTLFTTPVVYLFFDRLRQALPRWRRMAVDALGLRRPGPAAAPPRRLAAPLQRRNVFSSEHVLPTAMPLRRSHPRPVRPLRHRCAACPCVCPDAQGGGPRARDPRHRRL